MIRVIFAALLSVTSAAKAVTYVESTDFPDGMYFGGGSASAGVLDVGLNKVSGNLNGYCIVAPGGCNYGRDVSLDSQDSFVITIAAGTRLDSVTIDNTGTTGPAGFTFNVYLTNESASVIANPPPFPIAGTKANLLSEPFAAGVYSVTVFGQYAFEPGAFAVPYSLTFGVSAVPEPASAVLLLCGGLMLAARRRR